MGDFLFNRSLGNLKFGYDETTQKYGYWKKEADSEEFVPFNVYSTLGDVVQTLIPASGSVSTYKIIAPTATVSYYLKASTSGGYINLDDVRVNSVSAGLGQESSVSGTFEATQGQKVEFVAQYAGSVTITEHF